MPVNPSTGSTSTSSYHPTAHHYPPSHHQVASTAGTTATGTFKMPRSGTVSEKVWAQAIHAVNVQKMSLRRAAQLYGVHHMSLHRRVKGRYVQNLQHMDTEFRLTPEEENEVNIVLSEQFYHEKKVTSDDVRYVVRTIISQSGRKVPVEFPNNRWIANYKKLNGFSSPDDTSMEVDQTGNGTNSDRLSHQRQQGEQEEEAELTGEEQVDQEIIPPKSDITTRRSGSVSPKSAESQICHEQDQDQDEDQYSDSVNSETDQGGHISSSSSSKNTDEQETKSDTTDHSSTQVNSNSSNKKCQQSQTVPPEVWEKAMDAVEIHGMSLRNAAKAYGVHFAALHRRVKKRNQRQMAIASAENYLPFEDEAGIVRVINARADLGILMNYDELVELLHRTALKYTPSLSHEQSRNLISKFQTRTEHSIRHLIKDWAISKESYDSKMSNSTMSAGRAITSSSSSFSYPTAGSNAPAIARSLGVVTSSGSSSGSMTGGSKSFSSMARSMGPPTPPVSLGMKESPPLLPSLRHDLLRRSGSDSYSSSRDPREMQISHSDSIMPDREHKHGSPRDMYVPRSNDGGVYARVQDYERPRTSSIERMSSHPRFAMHDGVYPHVHSSHDGRVYHELSHDRRSSIMSSSNSSTTQSTSMRSSMQF